MKRSIVILAAGVLVTSAGAVAADSETFASAMTAAIERMHHAMLAAPTGNPDHDFARMMIPHHQGAIDMAKVELIYGKNQRLRRLSQAIIVEQQQEIAVMRHELAQIKDAPIHDPPTGESK